MTNKVVVVEYDPAWPSVFERLRTDIDEAVAHLAVAIEHVGSTAVPGLAAKPVIDMDVVVPQGRVGDAIARLAAIGYEHRGDLGVPGREAFHEPREAPRHHLYVCPAGSPALANHLAVRDYLRDHPEEARTYGALKVRLADEFGDDIDGYIEGKSSFLLGVLERVGFDPETLGEIERVNRRPDAG
ncbi:MAG: GrpB family protein [Gemmatimonadota bacterium]|nr:GrpB family protein [Gemmatimonadota bacterium]